MAARVPGREVVPAPTNRLVRRSLDMMHGSVVGGRYRVLGPIGSGGMGSVYEGLDLQTGCKVALKALQPGTQTPAQLKRLRHEAATATSVRNDHVCRVHYLGVEAGTPFIVMERLHGETLRTRLSEDGPLAVEDAVRIMCQLLDALTATHEVGIVHRDIKPSNIFLTSPRGEEPRMKLIDFGVATIVRSAGSRDEHSALTSADQITGTLHYLAPEQILATGDVDARADVYSAGVTFYEMLAGERAYSGSYAEIIHAIILGEPPKVSHLRYDLHPLFDDVLAMAMAKSRDRRFASAQAFKRALLAAWNASAGVTASGMVPRVRIEDARNHRDAETVDGYAFTMRPPSSDATMDAEPATEVARLDELPTLRPPPFTPGRR